MFVLVHSSYIIHLNFHDQSTTHCYTWFNSYHLQTLTHIKTTTTKQNTLVISPKNSTNYNRQFLPTLHKFFELQKVK